ncbi:MAG: XdhC family protein [Verrucomicrobiae bacterium]|nr:XdhC family protein [Verrucomicrobiae bacterium]
MLNFWNKVVYELDCYQKVFVAVVVDHRKGSPGTKRALFLVTEAKEVVGTIGGGVMEANLIREAKELIAAGNHGPALRTLEHREGDFENRSGLICGGAQTLVTMVLKDRHRDLLHRLVKKLHYGKPGCLVLRSTGMELEEEDLKKPSVQLAGDGENWEARLGFLNRKRVLISGGGHCGSALARQMDMLGFHVTVVEPREKPAGIGELPAHTLQRQLPYATAGTEIAYPQFTCAVVMTPSYAEDVEVLTALLPLDLPFVGAMGSPAKLKKIKDQLLANGLTNETLKRLTAPVGLPIESDTPEEIAVSVAAQILHRVKELQF